MSKDPAFLFYPNDWLGGTMGMTFEEKGAYMELLMLQFNRGHMTSHMIGQVIGQNWDKIKDKFIQDKNGLWYNQRLEDEKIKRQRYTESRRNNKSGVNQYTKKLEKKEGHMTSHMENENVNVNRIEYLNYFNEKFNRKFRLTDKIKKSFNARIKEYTIDELKKVVDNVHSDDWHSEKGYKYATPEYCLRPDQVEKWLNVQPAQKKSTRPELDYKESDIPTKYEIIN